MAILCTYIYSGFDALRDELDEFFARYGELAYLKSVVLFSLLETVACCLVLSFAACVLGCLFVLFRFKIAYNLYSSAPPAPSSLVTLFGLRRWEMPEYTVNDQEHRQIASLAQTLSLTHSFNFIGYFSGCIVVGFLLIFLSLFFFVIVLSNRYFWTDFVYPFLSDPANYWYILGAFTPFVLKWYVYRRFVTPAPHNGVTNYYIVCFIDFLNIPSSVITGIVFGAVRVVVHILKCFALVFRPDIPVVAAFPSLHQFDLLFCSFVACFIAKQQQQQLERQERDRKSTEDKKTDPAASMIDEDTEIKLRLIIEQEKLEQLKLIDK